MNVPDLLPGQHAIAVYDSPAEQERVLAEFVSAGLDRGERVLYFGHRSSPQHVAAALARNGIDVDSTSAEGRLVLAAADTTYLRSGAFDAAATKTAWFDAIAQTIAAGFDVMRVAADMNWAAEDVPGAAGLPSYELAIAEVFETGHVIGLCEFDRRSFDAELIDELTRLHSTEIHPNKLFQGAGFDVTRTAEPRGVAIAGDVDFYNREAFEAAIDLALSACVSGDVRIDLSRLRFIDAGGMSALLRCTRRLKPGTMLVLRGMRPHIRHAFAIMKWDRIAALRFE